MKGRRMGEGMDDVKGKQLEELRCKMTQAAELYGMNHPIVLHYSQCIDQMHNKLLQSSHSSFFSNGKRVKATHLKTRQKHDILA
ncbi:aspartyl-phosphate phosphatase Spo0E family protein [Alteribacillus persepolensis]|nr:aspartyl-phosphate phosphatase Spo0E family protein [Alteribacillus persepolensis]